MGLWDKLSNVARMVGSQISESLDVSTLNSRMGELNERLKDAYRKVGATMSLVSVTSDAVRAHQSKVAKLKLELAKLREREANIDREIAQSVRTLAQPGEQRQPSDMLALAQARESLRGQRDALRQETGALMKRLDAELEDLGKVCVEGNCVTDEARESLAVVTRIRGEIQYVQAQISERKKQGQQEREPLGAQLREMVMESSEARAQELSKYRDNPGGRLKKELSELPVLSAVGDAIGGVATIPQLSSALKSNPQCPLTWLHLGYSLKARTLISQGYRIVRAPFNPLGSIIGVGLRQVLKSIDRQKALTPDRCFLAAASLARKQIRASNDTESRASLMGIAGVACYEVACSCTDEQRKRRYIFVAKSCLGRAVRTTRDLSTKGEALYFLGKICQSESGASSFLRYMNLSRKVGFVPAVQELKTYMASKDPSKSSLSVFVVPKGVQEVKSFAWLYKPSAESRIAGALEHTAEQQLRKASRFGERIFDTIAKEFMK